MPALSTQSRHWYKRWRMAAHGRFRPSAYPGIGFLARKAATEPSPSLDPASPQWPLSKYSGHQVSQQENNALHQRRAAGARARNSPIAALAGREDCMAEVDAAVMSFEAGARQSPDAIPACLSPVTWTATFLRAGRVEIHGHADKKCRNRGCY